MPSIRKPSLLPFEVRVNGDVASRHYTIGAARRAVDQRDRQFGTRARTLRIHDTDTGREIE